MESEEDTPEMAKAASLIMEQKLKNSKITLSSLTISQAQATQHDPTIPPPHISGKEYTPSTCTYSSDDTTRFTTASCFSSSSCISTTFEAKATVQQFKRKIHTAPKKPKEHKEHEHKESKEPTQAQPFLFSLTPVCVPQVPPEVPALPAPVPLTEILSEIEQKCSANKVTYQSTPYGKICVIIFIIVIGVTAQFHLQQQRKIEHLEALLALCENPPTRYGAIEIPVYEDISDVSALDYLNKASAHFAGGEFAFTRWNKTSAHRIGLYSMLFLGRFDNYQEDYIRKLQRDKLFENVLVVAMRFNSPTKELVELMIAPELSGYRCGDREKALHVELSYYPFISGDEQILPFSCSGEGACSERNINQLRNFFKGLKHFHSKC